MNWSGRPHHGRLPNRRDESRLSRPSPGLRRRCPWRATTRFCRGLLADEAVVRRHHAELVSREGCGLGVDFELLGRAPVGASMASRRAACARRADVGREDGALVTPLPRPRRQRPRRLAREVHARHGLAQGFGAEGELRALQLCPGRAPAGHSFVHLESEGAWLPDELDHLRRVFKRVDEDGSGEIDRDELQKLLIELEHPLALDDYCVDDLFRRTDKDGSGHIDFRVLRAGLCRAARRHRPATVWIHGRAWQTRRLARSCVDDMTTQVPHRKLRRSPGSSASPKISSRRNGDP